MPFVLWPIVGDTIPLAAVFVSWAMLGTEDIGVQVERLLCPQRAQVDLASHTVI